MIWTQDHDPISNQKSKASPALAVFQDRLHMVHLGDSSNNLWHSSFDGTNWTENTPVLNQTSKASPALAVFQNRLHMVHLGDSSNDIWQSSYDGGSWTLGDSSNNLWHSVSDGRWRPNVVIEDQLSKAAVALAEFQNQLHVVHLGNASNAIWHSLHML
jgi:hypothetical protein